MFRASYRSLQTVANDAIFSQANVVTERLSGKKVVVTGPAETAAGRIDRAAWLRSLSRRQRTIASVLAGNHLSCCPEVPPQPRLNHLGNLLAQLANSIAAVPSGSSESNVGATASQTAFFRCSNRNRPKWDAVSSLCPFQCQRMKAAFSLLLPRLG